MWHHKVLLKNSLSKRTTVGLSPCDLKSMRIYPNKGFVKQSQLFPSRPLQSHYFFWEVSSPKGASYSSKYHRHKKTPLGFNFKSRRNTYRQNKVWYAVWIQNADDVSVLHNPVCNIYRLWNDFARLLYIYTIWGCVFLQVQGKSLCHMSVFGFCLQSQEMTCLQHKAQIISKNKWTPF